MGKSKQKQLGRHGRHRHRHRHQDQDPLPSSAFDLPPPFLASPLSSLLPPSDHHSLSPSKHQLYQLFVQSPKGDLSYLQKFYFTYVGGRAPVHMREDFCGTALICAEWVKGGIQRVATGLDLDSEALLWGLDNNVKKLGKDACSRVRLFNGNVLEPISMAQVIQTFTPFSMNLATEGHSLKTVEREEFSAAFAAHCRINEGLESEIGNFESDGKHSDADSAESVDNGGVEKKRGNNEGEGSDCMHWRL